MRFANFGRESYFSYRQALLLIFYFFEEILNFFKIIEINKKPGSG